MHNPSIADAWKKHFKLKEDLKNADLACEVFSLWIAF